MNILDGDVIVHKTIHTYTIRAKQGFIQSSRDNRQSSNSLRSAGANIRRQNEYNLAQVNKNCFQQNFIIKILSSMYLKKDFFFI